MSNGISLIVGLGNPGQRYHSTRHNAGAWFLERLCEVHGVTLKPENKFFGAAGRVAVADRDLRVLMPVTYMNHSGKAVAAISNFFKIPPAEILIAYDELDLPPGTVRLKTGGGPGGHKGLRDTINALGTREFHRLRIGIGHPGHASGVLDYVLGVPSRDDAEHIRDGLNRALDILPLLARGEFQKAMTRLHTSPENG